MPINFLRLVMHSSDNGEWPVIPLLSIHGNAVFLYAEPLSTISYSMVFGIRQRIVLADMANP